MFRDLKGILTDIMLWVSEEKKYIVIYCKQSHRCIMLHKKYEGAFVISNCLALLKSLSGPCDN